MTDNLLLLTDSYKHSHHLLYPSGTTYLKGYTESRGGLWNETVFFGLQYLLKEYLTRRITMTDVEEAKSFLNQHFGKDFFPYEAWKTIATELGGKLPIRIRAIPEGSIVPTHNLLVSVESTDERFPWIASWVETMLLRSIWYGTTVATQSYEFKKLIWDYLVRTSDDPAAEIAFKVHDFAGRGVSSHESAMIGGIAHLVNFRGTDTLEGILCGQRYYNEPMAGFSIPASEHSTMCMWLRGGEKDAFRNMLQQYGGQGVLFACVSDTYDIFNATSNLWGGELREEVINSGSTLVIRPDSGDPIEIIPEVLQRLDATFGSTLNSKSYKVLNHVRIIQGDGVEFESMEGILKAITAAGFSATNVAFGVGGTLLQRVNRDMLKFAHKACYAIVDGQPRDIYKDPVTDSGKRSKAGDLDLYEAAGGYMTLRREESVSPGWISQTRVVFENGELLVDESLEQIRSRASKSFAAVGVIESIAE